MEEIFKFRVERGEGRIVLEAWINDDEEPIAKRTVVMRDASDYFNVMQALYQTIRDFEREFTHWAQQQLFKK
jgi:hypothetical protein